jgi:WD40 repeat protein
VRAWNTDGSGQLLVLSGYTDTVNDVAFSPDGGRLASTSDDKTVQVWNADGSGPPLVLQEHTDAVSGVAWSPEGGRIASASFDNTVRVWRDLDPITPDDPRLWTLTSYCLSIELRKDLLGVSQEVARTLHERRQRRVVQASAPAGAGH